MPASFSVINTVTGTANQISPTPGLNPVFAIANNAVLPGTAGATLPTGTTGQRAGGLGTIRMNTTIPAIEGTLDGATWITIASGAGPILSITGTLNRITVSAGVNPVIDISGSYIGQASITTLGTITTGNWNGTILTSTYGGTGVNNGGSTITIGGNILTAGALTLAGAFAATFNFTAGTNVTFPTAGTLATTAGTVASVTGTANRITIGGTATNPTVDIAATYVGQTSITTLGTITTGVWNGSVIPLLYGGTNAALVASSGGIFYSTATAGAILAGTATAQQMLQSGATAAPAWSTATWPATTTINQLLYSSAANTVVGLAAANSAALVSTVAGVPVFSSSLTDGQIIIGATGGTPAAASLTAGTGITITPGANTLSIAVTGGAAVTSVSGTANRITSTGGTTPVIDISAAYIGQSSITTLGTITSGIWNGTIIPILYGGTGLAVANNQPSAGRLTLTSGTAVTTSDVTAATTIYFTPYSGNYITLYTSSAWKNYTFTQLSIAVPNTTATMYDVFVYDNASVLTLELVAWSSDNSRATAIALQDGVYCKNGALDRRYVGSFRTTAVAGQTEDSAAKRYVWNYYNRVIKYFSKTDATATWNYTTAAFQQANANAANQVEMVVGVVEDTVSVKSTSIANNTNALGAVTIASGVGVGSTTVNSGIGGEAVTANAIEYKNLVSIFENFPSLGRNFFVWLEYSSATAVTTWIGTSAPFLAGLTGFCKC